MTPFTNHSDAFAWIDQNATPGTLISVMIGDWPVVMNRRGQPIGAYPVGFCALPTQPILRPVPGDMMEFGK